jgi:hypothetical protein
LRLSTRYQQFKPQGQTCENVSFGEFSKGMKIVAQNEGTQIHGITRSGKTEKAPGQSSGAYLNLIQPAPPG